MNLSLRVHHVLALCTLIGAIVVAPFFIGNNAHAQSAATYVCPTILSTFSLDMKDPDPLTGPIGKLQQFLGAYYGTSVYTGIYGPATESLVKRFQREKGLPETGVTDHDTRLALLSPCIRVSMSVSGTMIQEGTGSAIVTVTRSGDTDHTLVVPVDISGTATRNRDYSLTMGKVTSSLRIEPGMTSTSTTLAAIADTVADDNETITFSLSANTSYTAVPPNSVTVTITPPPPPPQPPTPPAPKVPVLVFEGDSLTASSSIKWPTQLLKLGLRQFSSATVFNGGEVGDKASSMVGEYAKEGHAHQPSAGQNAYFFLWAGTNDLAGSNDTPETIYANLKKLWASARADGFKVVAFTVKPFGAINGTPRDADRVKLNQLIQSDPSLYDYVVRADLVLPNWKNLTYFSTDGTHLTEGGNKKIMIEVATVLSGTTTVTTMDTPQYDFLVMDVCVDANDHVIKNLMPGDKACTSERNIRQGEILPYHKYIYPSPKTTICKNRLGTILRDSLPVTLSGVTRAIAVDDHGVDDTCPGVTSSDSKFGVLDAGDQGGLSVAWYDSTYVFLMGSWSPEAYSYFYSPQCDSAPGSSRAFYRGWILGPLSLYQGSATSSGFSVGRAGLSSDLLSGCPQSYRSYLSTWARDMFAYTSGKKFDSVISEKFSSIGSDQDEPGAAQAMERIYLTKEFGYVTRWEAWKRDDLGLTPPVLDRAKSLYAAGTCGLPHDMPARLSPHMRTEPVSTAGGMYSEAVIDDTTGERHVWYMTLCTDFTNVHLDPHGGSAPPWSSQVQPVFWKEPALGTPAATIQTHSLMASVSDALQATIIWLSTLLPWH
jgi:peptidoglycan hydrolase-like protein with peptidoglycan-binding domain